MSAVAGQIGYDYREPADWAPEPEASIKCGDAIDKLKAAVRAFGNGKQPEALGSIEDAIYALLDNPDVEKCVIEAVRSHMRRNCFVEAL